VNVRSSFEVTKPDLRIEIDRNRAAALGVAVADISRTLQILFGGLDLTKIKLEGKEYDVIAQLERASRRTPRDLERLYVRSDRGELIQLSSVVSYQSGAAPNAVEHYDRLRSATITATPVGVTLGTAVQQVESMLATDLPVGFLYAWSGESRDFKDAQTEFWWILGLAIVIVYMVLASQFESLIHPFTVMLALPLAGVGAFGLIWLMHFLGQTGVIPPIPAMNFNLFSQIGLVLLVGLVTKNSILLVEFANQRRAKGANPHEAMLQAGLIRLRPILMTSFSTIAGILPIAIGFGAGAESRRPMGMAVVGGMITSTFLTLFVIPVVYTFFSQVAAWRRPKPAPAPTANVAEPAAK
jgi:multidrug efflux pump subunit AcrB